MTGVKSHYLAIVFDSGVVIASKERYLVALKSAHRGIIMGATERSDRAVFRLLTR